jgi:hypothetical protein
MIRPPPLPPGARTVGQLVAETLRLYGRRFWRALALGVPPALAGVGQTLLEPPASYVWPFTVFALAQAVSYYAAVLLVHERRASAREAATTIGVGYAVFLPVSILLAVFLIPAALWLALVGLAVPAAVLERLGPTDALKRGIKLARADFIHSLGAFATLILFGLVAAYGLFFLLRGQAEATLAAAGFLSVLVVQPVLYLGATLLYDDQAARLVDSAAPNRRRDADVRDAVDADRPGRPDPEVESRAAARGEP